LDPIIETSRLVKHFYLGGLFGRRQKVVHAVDDVDLCIPTGKIFALVGESGCGKTTFGRMLVGLTSATSGNVFFQGNELRYCLNQKSIRRQLQFVFQDTFASLNPRKSVREALEQPFAVHATLTRKELGTEVVNLLDMVGLTPPQIYEKRYPHELSGGQRQRVAIARAIAVHPRFIVADEPVSQLDVSVRAQILLLLTRLQEELKLTYLLISHDLALVRTVANHVAIMYLGKILEEAAVEEVFEYPLHPYTQILLDSTPIPDPRLAKRKQRTILRGDPASPIDPPSGCRFRTRCPHVSDRCTSDEPVLVEIGPNHKVACHSCSK